MPKILIVDDDPIIRNLLVQILEPFEGEVGNPLRIAAQLFQR